MQAMIYAAGLGTRLRPLTNDRPKALVEVGGKTLLEHLLMRLRAAGVDLVVINIHHFGDQIIAFLEQNRNFGMNIRISDERDELLDTGGGFKHALPLLRRNEPVLIHNVDIISEIDLRDLWNSSLDLSEATLCVSQRETQRYLLWDYDHLLGWENVNTGEKRGPILGMEQHRYLSKQAFNGIAVVKPSLMHLLENYPAKVFSIIDFYLAVCGQHWIQPYLVRLGETSWLDCGKVDALPLAEQIIDGRQYKLLL
jgi:NDP-sugar pyrophosphorylase family protein